MNQKKALRLRKLARYQPANDLITERKYMTLVCTKVTQPGERPIRTRSGYMIVCKDERLKYRQIKKLYKEGKVLKEKI